MTTHKSPTRSSLLFSTPILSGYYPRLDHDITSTARFRVHRKSTFAVHPSRRTVVENQISRDLFLLSRSLNADTIWLARVTDVEDEEKLKFDEELAKLAGCELSQPNIDRLIGQRYDWYVSYTNPDCEEFSIHNQAKEIFSFAMKIPYKRSRSGKTGMLETSLSFASTENTPESSLDKHISLGDAKCQDLARVYVSTMRGMSSDAKIFDFSRAVFIA